MLSEESPPMQSIKMIDEGEEALESMEDEDPFMKMRDFK